MKINNQHEYDAAKRELQLKQENSVFQCCVNVTAEMISDALLEYRRQNNIFEVGDKVVFVWQLESNDIFKVHDIDSGFIAVKRESDERTYYAYEEYGLIHATDAEIEAGKRGEIS